MLIALGLAGAGGAAHARQAPASTAARDQVFMAALADTTETTLADLRAYEQSLPPNALAARADALGLLAFLTRGGPAPTAALTAAHASVSLQRESGEAPRLGALVARMLLATLGSPEEIAQVGRDEDPLASLYDDRAPVTVAFFLNFYLASTMAMLEADRLDEALVTVRYAVDEAESGAPLPAVLKVQAYLAFGTVLTLQYRLDEAFEAQMQALRLLPRNANVKLSVAATIVENLGEGDCRRVVASLEPLVVAARVDVDLSTDDFLAYETRLGDQYARCGDPQRAIAIFQKAIARGTIALPATDPDLAAVKAALADVLATLGDLDRADDYLDEATVGTRRAQSGASLGQAISLQERILATRARVLAKRGAFAPAARGYDVLTQSGLAFGQADKRLARWLDAWASVLEDARQPWAALSAQRLASLAWPNVGSDSVAAAQRRETTDHLLEAAWRQSRDTAPSPSRERAGAR
ncbi:tetratricopeptide repeat protein [Caulobacter vibrioides]|uniref:Tetratricopeptide repeat protein n=1 Tax=Caulobacter vibrioides TaxID=155892 RepID=A0A290MJJ4_CAUVI|nr:tetratricopeptide repeat protein [Caulobacter vibrioides]